ncbi:MAG: biotin carboxylase, partial [Flavobacteriales bacterium]
SAGGGGKGMRVVHDPTRLRGETERAMSEARSAFGNGAVFLERFVTEPRHIEIQVLCDAHGNGVHLFER